MKRILVTGGSGFFGLHLCRHLVETGYHVRVLDLVQLNEPALESRCEFLQGDIRDNDSARRACAGVDAVIHNAAVVPVSRSGSRFWSINVEGTRSMLDAAVQEHVGKFVYISSSSAYGIPAKIPIDEQVPLNPFGQYGRSKAAAENLCGEYRDRLDISIIRPRTILGTGRMGILQILFDWVREGRKFYIFGPGANRFQLISAPDLARACELVVAKPCANEDFNIGAQEFSTLRGDLEGLARKAGTKTRIISLPIGLARTMLQILDLLRLSPFVDYHYHILNHDVWFDTAKAENMLGWTSHDSNIDMLYDAYQWYLDHQDEVRHEVGTTHRKRVKLGLIKIVKWLS